MSIVGPVLALGTLSLALVVFARMLWRDTPKREDRPQGGEGQGADFGSGGFGH